jgi:hypothetical protein
VLPYDASALVAKGSKVQDVEFQFRAAPLIHEGKVIVGATGFEANRFDDDLVKASLAADVGKAWIDANLGRRAFLAALDSNPAPKSGAGTPPRRTAGKAITHLSPPTGRHSTAIAAPLYKNAWAA